MEEKKTFFLLAKSTSKTIFIEIYFLFSRNCLCFPADSKMDAGEEFAQQVRKTFVGAFQRKRVECYKGIEDTVQTKRWKYQKRI